MPADEVLPTLGELFDEAWDRTAERMAIPAPKSDGMRVGAVRGVAFNARCNYLQRKVELNIDPVLTRPGLKHLAVHECYPGHYVQFKLREVWYAEGRGPGRRPALGGEHGQLLALRGHRRQRPVSARLVRERRRPASDLLTRYRSGIGTAAAWHLHAEGRDEGQVRDWLRANALVGGEGWVDNRMRFISAPQRSVLIWSYWWGEAAVTPAYLGVPAERRGDFLRFLYGRMHSVQTVGMFV